MIYHRNLYSRHQVVSYTYHQSENGLSVQLVEFVILVIKHFYIMTSCVKEPASYSAPNNGGQRNYHPLASRSRSACLKPRAWHR
jgi:hypothetical protein